MERIETHITNIYERLDRLQKEIELTNAVMNAEVIRVNNMINNIENYIKSGFSTTAYNSIKSFDERIKKLEIGYGWIHPDMMSKRRVKP